MEIDGFGQGRDQDEIRCVLSLDKGMALCETETQGKTPVTHVVKEKREATKSGGMPGATRI